MRDDRWSEAIAVGSLAFVEKIKSELGIKAIHREVVQLSGTYELREQSEAYGGACASENDPLTSQNMILWQRIAETTRT
jgi:hypothetical protein